MNINNDVEVVLTERGAALLSKEKPDVQAGKPVRVQLWVLMQALGPQMYMGGHQLILDNEIRFLPSALNPAAAYATLEVEHTEGDPIDFDAVSKALASQGVELSSWAPGYHMLARRVFQNAVSAVNDAWATLAPESEEEA